MMCVCVCVCVCVYVHMSAGAHGGPEEDIWSYEAGVMNNCELPNQGAGNQTWMLKKNNKCT